MSSARRLKMSWPSLNESIRIDLLADKAPSVCNLLWDCLPYKSIQSHALITGYMMLATSPVFTLARENLRLYTEAEPGDCLYGPGSQNVVLTYGPLTEPEGAGVWGKVLDKDLDALARVGRRAWENLVAPYGNVALNPTAKQSLLVVCERA
jgi:hypothetical protein